MRFCAAYSRQRAHMGVPATSVFVAKRRGCSRSTAARASSSPAASARTVRPKSQAAQYRTRSAAGMGPMPTPAIQARQPKQGDRTSGALEAVASDHLKPAARMPRCTRKTSTWLRRRSRSRSASGPRLQPKQRHPTSFAGPLTARCTEQRPPGGIESCSRRSEALTHRTSDRPLPDWDLSKSALFRGAARWDRARAVRCRRD